MPIEPWKQGKEIFNGQRFNNGLRYFPLFSFIWCNPQHYEGLKPSRYTGIINKNQIYIIMESQYKVCEVKLTYKSPQHYEGLKPSRYTGIINKNQIYIIMESQYKVCEVKLTYKSKIKASEREKILSAEKPSRYTGIINKNQIYIIMESQYKVCEVKLTYKSKIKASEREKILSAENAYKILLSVFDSETIQYKEFFKVILMNRANKVLGSFYLYLILKQYSTKSFSKSF